MLRRRQDCEYLEEAVYGIWHAGRLTSDENLVAFYAFNLTRTLLHFQEELKRKKNHVKCEHTSK